MAPSVSASSVLSPVVALRNQPIDVCGGKTVYFPSCIDFTFPQVVFHGEGHTEMSHNL